MLKGIRHVYHLLLATSWLVFTFGQAMLYFRKKGLSDLSLPHPAPLNHQEKKRLKHYFYGTAFLATLFCALRGRSRNNHERQRFSNLSALACFFDDLADDWRAQDDASILWHNNPEQYGAVADERGLSLHFLKNVHETLPPIHANQFENCLHRVFNIEAQGRQQTHAQVLSIQELSDITQEKGGSSVLLFRCLMDNALSDQERAAWHLTGGLIQLCDDIFDVWFDHQAGVETLALRLLRNGELTLLESMFQTQVSMTYKAIRASSDHHFRTGTTVAIVHFLVSITRVCLSHYRRTQKKLGQLPLHNRHVMVVDMERWPNRIEAGRELFRLSPIDPIKSD
ncbi:MAG: hypothetical protein IT269_03990 [Saprospiraceae bacterium]|nr:hypothetical protein [Saprospiraceae bacterium]